MAASLSHIPEWYHMVSFSWLTMTCWQVFWYFLPVSFAGAAVGSWYEMVWSPQMPAGKLPFGNMLGEQGAEIIFTGLSGIQAYPTLQLLRHQM